MFYFLSYNWKGISPDISNILWNTYFLYPKLFFYTISFIPTMVDIFLYNNYSLYFLYTFFSLLFILGYFSWLYKKYESVRFFLFQQRETNAWNISDRYCRAMGSSGLVLSIQNIFSKTNSILNCTLWRSHLTPKHKQMSPKGVPMRRLWK